MDFVLEIPNNLSAEKCEEMIKRFENDERKKPGVTLGTIEHGQDCSEFKKSLDLAISHLPEWKDMDTYLFEQLKEGIEKYRCHLHKHLGCVSWIGRKLDDSGYQIQKTVKGGYYSWHSDELLTKKRVFTFLWYLNTFDPISEGGGTAFHPTIGGGKIITPEQGKLILFPATWTYVHMGLPIVTDKNKYVCTGWIHADNAL